MSSAEDFLHVQKIVQEAYRQDIHDAEDRCAAICNAPLAPGTYASSGPYAAAFDSYRRANRSAGALAQLQFETEICDRIYGALLLKLEDFYEDKQ